MDQAEVVSGGEEGRVDVGDDVDDSDRQPLHVKRDADDCQQRQVLAVPSQLPAAADAVSAQVHARAQKAADEKMQRHDGGGGQGVLEDEQDQCVHPQHGVVRPVLHAQRQDHLAPGDVPHVLQAVIDSQGRGQPYGQHPDGRDDHAGQPLVRVWAPEVRGAHDGPVPLHGDGQDGEDGHEDVSELQEGRCAAQQLAELPVFEREAQQGEGHAQHTGEDVRHD